MRLLQRVLVVLAVGALAPFSLWSQTAESSAPTPTGAAAGDRPTVALVLSGGGAKGAAHVGVLKVLEELRVPVDMIVGTSMGAIVGGLYAAGYSPEQMEHELIETDWRAIFSDRASPPEQSFRLKRAREEYGYIEVGLGADGFEFPSGFITGQRLGFRLKSLLLHTAGTDDFDDLRIPYRAVAADLETGQEVVLEEGNVAEAMRASMAVPGVFAPVERDGRILVDGGVVNNLPINVARELGADVIIAVLVSSQDITAKDGEELGNSGADSSEAGGGEEDLEDETDEPSSTIAGIPSVLDVSFRVIDLVTRRNVLRQTELLQQEDVYLTVDTSPYTAAAFAQSSEIIALGIEHARDAASEISRHGISEDDFEAYLSAQRYTGTPRIRIDRIEIRSSDRVPPERIRSRMRTEAGDRLELGVLERDIERIYGLGFFRTVDFDVVERDGDTVLVVTAEDKPWGPNYLRFGISVYEDFQGGGSYTATSQYAMTQLNRLGAELRVSTQIGRTLGVAAGFYQPLDLRNRFFLEPAAEVQQSVTDVYEDGRRQAQYQVRRADGNAYVGMNVAGRVEMRLGMGATYGTAGPLIGGEELEDDDFRQIGHRGALLYDDLDSATFPREGTNLAVSWTLNRRLFGSDFDTQRVDLTGLNAFSAGRHALLLSTQAIGTWSERNIFPFGPSLGGFLRFSGYRVGELSGNYLGQASLSYYYELIELPPALGNAIHVGASAETGAVWDHLENAAFSDVLFGGSAFIGVDTNIGPLYLAYGLAQGRDRGNFYLILGPPVMTR